jgi:predicted glycosyltransferase
MGIGHMRRNLLIAGTLARGPSSAVILMIAGARHINAYGLPPGVDCLSLPALRKEANGRYQSRHLDLPLSELIALRAHLITAALEAFAPDVLIVDKVPRGAVNELDTALEILRRGGRTRCVLGLRDVLDEPETVRREWLEGGYDWAVRDWYHTIWVYGDPTVYDPVAEYGFPPDVAARVRYTGYLDQRQRTRLEDLDGGYELSARLAESPGRLALCLVGGGEDGAPLAEAFAEGFARADFPPDLTGVILTGPFMPPGVREGLHRQAARACRAGAPGRLRILDFVTDTDLLLDRADRVVTMGGYNTVCEVLSYEKPALVVPRVRPRLEQLIRAERLRDLGLLDLLHPDDLSPRALTEWLARDLGPVSRARDRIDLNGLDHLPALIADLLGDPCARAANSCRQPEPEREPHHVVH